MGCFYTLSVLQLPNFVTVFLASDHLHPLFFVGQINFFFFSTLLQSVMVIIYGFIFYFAACPFCQHTAQWQLVQLLITLFFVLCIILPALQTYILYWHTLMPLLLKITKEKAYLIELFFLKLHRSWSVNHCSIQSLLQITVASPCYNFSRQYPSFWPGLNQDQLFDSHPLIISTIQPSFTASTCNNSFLTFR